MHFNSVNGITENALHGEGELYSLALSFLCYLINQADAGICVWYPPRLSHIDSFDQNVLSFLWTKKMKRPLEYIRKSFANAKMKQKILYIAAKPFWVVGSKVGLILEKI